MTLVLIVPVPNHCLHKDLIIEPDFSYKRSILQAFIHFFAAVHPSLCLI